MAVSPHPAAIEHLPWFIAGPGQSDTLLTFATVVTLITVLALGILFFRLHSLPERMGHKKFQFEIVAVLCLLSLFTHVHLFWVAGLLLALVDLPDFTTPLNRTATALEKLSGAGPDADHVPAVTTGSANGVVTQHAPGE
ncbi:MAG: hypothetical protein ACT4N2_02945 [Hyphomicrobium sp.]